MFESCENRAVARAHPPTRTETAACARRLSPRLARPPQGTAGGAPLHSPPGDGVAVGLGGGSDVAPKQRGEVTLVGVTDPSADLVEGERGPRQQVLRTLHPAPDDVLVRRLPGRLLEQVRKVHRACLRHSGELDEGQGVLQMRLNIGGRALQLGQGEPAVERRIEVPAEGVHDVRCSWGPLPLTPNDIVDNGSTA
jgi:hypothetical protein